ncbi:MAG: HAMP domain-containing histidine kinase, partial [Cyanobacteria bacterium]|nr:HAMP domain-containing histidine kinase [Cyanobacteriota bacterium]
MTKLFHFFGNNLSIRRKGLILVCIPLVFQIALSILLGTLYTQAERQAYKEAQARLVMVRANAVVSDLFKCGHYLVTFSAMRDDNSRQQWYRAKANIVEEIDSLKTMSTARENTASAYLGLLSVSNKALAMLDESFRRAESRTPYGFFKMYPQVKSFFDTLEIEFQQVLLTDLKGQVNGALSEEKTRRIIAICLYAGIVIDILIALGLSLFFASSIEKRIATIKDNTRRLRDKTQLNPEVEGTDEIAALDRDFHELSTALKESERMRSEFLSMVGHDIRTPLMSAELSLDLASSRLKKENGSVEVIEELETASKNMERVMSLIKDLLDLERGASGKLSLELEDLSVQSLINRTCKTARPLAEKKNVSLVIKCGDEEVIADRKRVEQVLLNLLTNAIKFAPPG